ncbi:MAG: hypothetical protein E5X53_32725 [Mesorhizobium sp.]|uniref:hypothetical protein n=1 Tax=Mesorhizobium sp. TaxID=1871066 RepID=UPI000FE929C6|nr:hypothetical protein [Mesorhizobium sp.]RWM13111.1 MAG: hypothetical protein EOR73_29865 [Mesorhizobium sp.]TIP69435.1 MAG: hypothetical protein E5X55_32320 [Mesorhizobium sp.]TIQ03503.1 MAG: hypothetical protein E5X57_30770 [Mesorhizobium sp.]TIR47734.1 MAG: hypothetical protein E5X53_32725 [Mesorhizobium sp.]TJV94568.1 MAG: hypothetical protein E5X52_28550 [Mesorhizobium sp.]
MSLDRDWDSIRPDRSFRSAGMGILRITLLFGSAAVALALIAAPLLDSRTRLQSGRADFAGGLDRMSTGSIGGTGSIGRRETYTLRRSVLQPLPTSICVIRDNGERSGDC